MPPTREASFTGLASLGTPLYAELPITRATLFSACADPQPRQNTANRNRKIRIAPIAAPNRNVIRVVGACHHGQDPFVMNVTGARARPSQYRPASHKGGLANVCSAGFHLSTFLPGLFARSAKNEPPWLGHRNLVIPVCCARANPTAEPFGGALASFTRHATPRNWPPTGPKL